MIRPIVRGITRPVVGSILGSRGGAGIPKDKFQFLWNGEVNGDNLKNDVGDYDIIVTGRDFTNTIPVTSSATFTLPDSNDYKYGDRDFFWQSMLGVLRDVPASELASYDLSRTFIKYDNSSPYSVSKIGILKEDAVLTDEEKTALYKYFNLPIWWDGTFSENGYVKDNRPLAQRYVYNPDGEVETITYFNRLENFIPTADVYNLDQFAKDVKTSTGVLTLSDVADQILIAGATEESFCKNFVKAAYDAIPVNSPAYVAYEGYTGNGTDSYIDTKYNPYGHPGIYKQNDGSIMVGIRNNVISAHLRNTIGSIRSASNVAVGMNPQRTTTNMRAYVNSGSPSQISPEGTSVGYSSVVRVGATEEYAYKNKTKGTASTAASGDVLDGNLYLCAVNYFGSPGVFNPYNICYWGIYKSLTDSQLYGIIDSVESYLTNYGKQLL